MEMVILLLVIGTMRKLRLLRRDSRPLTEVSEAEQEPEIEAHE